MHCHASLDSAIVERHLSAQNFTLFQEAMHKKHLRVQDAPRDGNCFYWSLSHQISQRHTQQELCRMLVSHLQALSEVCIINHIFQLMNNMYEICYLSA